MDWRYETVLIVVGASPLYPTVLSVSLPIRVIPGGGMLMYARPLRTRTSEKRAFRFEGSEIWAVVENG